MPNDTVIQKNSSLGFDGGWRGAFLENVPANIEWLPPTCGGVLHLMTRLLVRKAGARHIPGVCPGRE